LAYSSNEHENVKRELEAVATAYMPNHLGFKFQHLFLNVVDNPAQRVKPPQVVDELSWKQALRDAGGPNNPDRWGTCNERTAAQIFIAACCGGLVYC